MATVSASAATIPPSSSSSFCRHLQPQHGSCRCCSDCPSPSFCPAAASRRRRSYDPPIRYPLLRSKGFGSHTTQTLRSPLCATTIAAFVRMTVEDSKKLAFTRILPFLGCFLTETELTWLNAHLTKIWPYVDEEFLLLKMELPQLDRLSMHSKSTLAQCPNTYIHLYQPIKEQQPIETRVSIFAS
ncbi:unnamed protein product [Lactuca saligna]|uniref:Uncharacterized protein n=1 Tax=Lactuca saligna TaxID=75948 RepID=A0AA35YU06_LACSI|nr:unnamed protein product [Lactuca saligna]